MPEQDATETATIASHAPVHSTGPVSPRGPLPLVEVPTAYYVLEAEHGRGGIGIVQRARDLRTDRVVALKQLQTLSPASRIRFEREMRITARLQHPGVVPVHETGCFPSGEPFYAMKLVQGRSLKELVADRRTLQERLPLLPHVIAIAETIAYAHHERVVHRDLKPSNVIVGSFGETIVIDWGLAKALDGEPEAHDNQSSPYRRRDDDDVTMAGQIVGTPAYMPPEQARGGVVGTSADVYAIGAILYHVLAGKPPYAGASSAEVLQAVADRPPVRLLSLLPQVPSDLHAIVEKAMAREIQARYSSAAELADDLRRFQAGQLVRAVRYSSSAIALRWIRAHLLAVSTGIAIIALVLVGGATSFSRIEKSRVQAEAALRDSLTKTAELENARHSLEGHLSPAERYEWLVEQASNGTDSGAASADIELSTRVESTLLKIGSQSASSNPQARPFAMCLRDVCFVMVSGNTIDDANAARATAEGALRKMDFCEIEGQTEINTRPDVIHPDDAPRRVSIFARLCWQPADVDRWLGDFYEQLASRPSLHACLDAGHQAQKVSIVLTTKRARISGSLGSGTNEISAHCFVQAVNAQERERPVPFRNEAAREFVYPGADHTGSTSR